ncbi:MAG: radical SAM protein [Candidatus Njordarchaeia archaeon]
MEYPKILQLEPTNMCNFNCLMCIRRFWNTELSHMSMDLYTKIAREVFPNIERLTLYGEGEPLIHPNILDMVRMAKELLPKDATVFFITNGSLMSQKMADKLFVDLKMDEVAFSVDTTDFPKLQRIRNGIHPLTVFKNLEYVAKLKEKEGFKLGISMVLMRDNYADFPDMVEIAASMGIDYITVSHIVPYSKEMSEALVYSTLSKESFEISKNLLESEVNFILKAVYEVLFQAYGVEIENKASASLKTVWLKAKSRDLEVNPIGLVALKEKLDLLYDVQKVINESRNVAKKFGIKLDAPDVFPSIKDRSCPYIDKKAVFVRHDGKVAPCMNYAYTHPTYVNGHIRIDKEVIFGDLNKENFMDIWMNEKFIKFRDMLSNMNKNLPWCGDCPYSSTGCWFVNTNDMDCYGNEPTCNECLYSIGLSKCIL